MFMEHLFSFSVLYTDRNKSQEYVKIMRYIKMRKMNLIKKVSMKGNQLISSYENDFGRIIWKKIFVQISIKPSKYYSNYYYIQCI